MIKKQLKNKKIQDFMEKYNVHKEYTSVNKRMIARGIFIGLFIAMIPMPFQMLAVLVFTVVGKFNVPIALIMCWITNPFTMPFIYYIEYLTGSFLLGIEPQEVHITLEWFETNLADIVIPLYFGALCYSIILSTSAYLAISFYWKRKLYNLKKIRRS